MLFMGREVERAFALTGAPTAMDLSKQPMDFLSFPQHLKIFTV